MFKKNKYTLPLTIGKTNLLFNTLYGTIDIIEDEEVFKNIKSDNLGKIKEDLLKELNYRKYIIEESEHENLQINFKDNKKAKFYIVFSYLCNFECPYCFEKELTNNKVITLEMLNNIFKGILQIKNNYNFEDLEINLYGGEPLLEENRKLIEKVFLFAKSYNISVSIITNGSNVKNYKELLIKYKNALNLISITIDGPKENHNLKRRYKNGKGSYDNIINSINLLLDNDINLNIRVNMDGIKFSYKKILEKLYLDLNEQVNVKLFKIEDNKCLGSISNILEDRDIVDIFTSNEFQFIFKRYPVTSGIKRYNQIKRITEVKEFIYPLFRYCEVGNLFTFDPSGYIFICPESTGDLKFTLGSYYPDININENKVKKLQNLSCNTFNTCKDCDISPLCGGGCPYESFNRNKDINKPNCKYDEIYSSIEKYIEARFLDG